MPNNFFSLDDVTQPEACITASVEDESTSLVDFGFDAEMVERTTRAYIYVHDEPIFVKWAQDYPRVQPTTEKAVESHRRHIVEPPPTPAPNDGHGVAAGQEREIIGRRAIANLRMISATTASSVTITLES